MRGSRWELALDHFAYRCDAVIASIRGAALAELRDRVGANAKSFYTYYVDGTERSDPTRHVYLDYKTPIVSHGVSFEDWLREFVDAEPSLEDVPKPAR